MRHGKRLAKLGRRSSHRKATLANMVASLLDHELIQTTDVRAKELRRTTESMITFGKRQDLHARRQVLRSIPNKRIVDKLFGELAERYKGRNGGYTRIVKLGPRRGDGALISCIELVDRSGSGKAPKAESSPRASDTGDTDS